MFETKKRIVFFIESFSGGGAERVLYTILRYINRERFDVTILVMNDAGVQRDVFHSLGFKIINVLDNRIPLLNNIKYKLIYNILPAKVAAKWLLTGIKADTYVAFVEGYCTKIFSTLSPKKRTIAWVHTDLKNFPWPVEKRIYSSFESEGTAYKNYCQVIGVSNEVTEVMKHAYRLSDVLTIYNPIDELRIKSLSEAPGDIKVDKRSFNIISVGRLTRPKGYDLLIGIMPGLVKHRSDIKLYIVGEGEDRASLEEQITLLGLKSHVILTGFLQNPYSLMARMDAFVCSSRVEGFSLVIAEAMIVGLPVISMECAGPCELLDNGKYGILCKSYDELTKSIMAVAKDGKFLESLRAKSQQRAKDFNTEKTIKHIEEIL